MRYFQDTTGKIYGYDDSNPTQLPLITKSIAKNLVEITGSWPPVITLAQAQLNQNTILYAQYLTAVAATISYTSIGGVTKLYQCDPISISNLQSLLIAFKENTTLLPSTFFWVASDNTQVIFTYTDMSNLAQLIGLQGVSAFSHLQSKKLLVAAATTVAAVSAITW